MTTDPRVLTEEEWDYTIAGVGRGKASAMRRDAVARLRAHDAALRARVAALEGIVRRLVDEHAACGHDLPRDADCTVCDAMADARAALGDQP